MTNPISPLRAAHGSRTVDPVRRVTDNGGDVYRPTLTDFSLRISNRLAAGLPIPRPRYITNVAGAPDIYLLQRR